VEGRQMASNYAVRPATRAMAAMAPGE
jgi:hypothetical protein